VVSRNLLTLIRNLEGWTMAKKKKKKKSS